MTTYGQVIYELRKNRHLTQLDVSKGITSQATFSRFEKGEAYVSAENLFRYLKRLRVHPTEFFAIAEDETFDDYYYFYKMYLSAMVDLESRDKLIAQQKALYEATHDEVFQIHIAQIKLGYAKSHQQPLTNYVRETKLVIDYFLNLEYWHTDDVDLYIGLLFVFGNAHLRRNQANLLNAIAQVPFSKERQQNLRFMYANNALILMFERLAIADVPDYLLVAKAALPTSASGLAQRIAYNVFEQLYQLTQSFEKQRYERLLTAVEIFAQYGFESEYDFYVHLITQTLTKLQLIPE